MKHTDKREVKVTRVGTSLPKDIVRLDIISPRVLNLLLAVFIGLTADHNTTDKIIFEDMLEEVFHLCVLPVALHCGRHHIGEGLRGACACEAYRLGALLGIESDDGIENRDHDIVGERDRAFLLEIFTLGIVVIEPVLVDPYGVAPLVAVAIALSPVASEAYGFKIVPRLPTSLQQLIVGIAAMLVLHASAYGVECLARGRHNT